MKRITLVSVLLALIVMASASCTASRGGRSAGCYANKGMVGYH
ncbi:MAG: hypothetical protein ACOVQS_13650 [Chitinophagaceae bacterium]